VKFLVDDEDVLVDTAAQEFDVNAPIYVGGVPGGFTSPTDTLVNADFELNLSKHFCYFMKKNFCIAFVH